MLRQGTLVDADAIVQLLTKLRCDNIKVREKWVTAGCPLAQWRHRKAGTDRRSSFGVAIEPKGESRWHCHSCANGGTLNELLWVLRRYDTKKRETEFELIRVKDAPMDFSSLRERLGRAETIVRTAVADGGMVSETRIPADLDFVADRLETVPEEHLTRYFVPISESREAERYLLETRNLPQDVWDSWGLLWHPGSKRIAIPLRDHKGRLKGITGRAVRSGDKLRWLHSKGFRRDYMLFGENHLPEGVEVAYVVEGHFDTMYLWAYGYVGAVGVMGSYLSPYQLHQFQRFFKRVVIFRDGDAAGRDAARRWYEALAPRMPTTIADVIDGRDPDQYSALELEERLGPPPTLKSVTENVQSTVDIPN